MAKITFGDLDSKAELGDVVQLRNQEQEVVKCQDSGVLMLNIDPTDVRPGDLPFIKALGLTISNPDTTDPVAIQIDTVKGTLGDKVAMWWNTDSSDDSEFFDEDARDYSDIASVLLAATAASALDSDDDSDDDDDSSSSFSGFGHSSGSFGGFGGGSSFGGFGGGSFSGGGATGSW